MVYLFKQLSYSLNVRTGSLHRDWSFKMGVCACRLEFRLDFPQPPKLRIQTHVKVAKMKSRHDGPIIVPRLAPIQQERSPYGGSQHPIERVHFITRTIWADNPIVRGIPVPDDSGRDIPPSRLIADWLYSHHLLNPAVRSLRLGICSS